MPFSSTYKVGGDLEVNRLGFGAMRIVGPGNFGMPENPQNSIDLLKRVIELGVNFIDTADQYGAGTSEQLIAEALYPYKKGLVIATKGGIVRHGPGPDITFDASPKHLTEALDASLDRLKLDQIDLYQLHRIDPKTPAEKSFEFLKQAQEDGKIKHVGLSEVSVEEIKKAQKYFTVASVQNKYSVDNRKWEDVLDYCKEQDIAFIPWFPIGGGEMQGLDVLERVASEHDSTVRQVALSWLLHHADNILLIPGTSSISHLEENMASANISLTDQNMQDLDSIASTNK